jgi:NitT/TauT family transport system ATP-binding protein
VASRPAASTKLRVEDVTLEYSTAKGTITALDHVSFDVADKEFAVLVGPSGCGKSSLLYLAAGLTDPTSGEIMIDNRVVEAPGADRGMVFQSYTLFPWLRVRENVEFGLKRRGVPAAERREIVEHYLAEIGLTQFADVYPNQLSGGMMQRVAIARALANDPEVLLMDEPFGALDSQTRSQMQRLLLRVWEHSQKTVLFVTHDIDEAILLGDRVYVMTKRPGRIKEEIPIAIAHPRSMDLILNPQFLVIKRRILNLLQSEQEEH